MFKSYVLEKIKCYLCPYFVVVDCFSFFKFKPVSAAIGIVFDFGCACYPGWREILWEVASLHKRERDAGIDRGAELRDCARDLPESVKHVLSCQLRAVRCGRRQRILRSSWKVNRFLSLSVCFIEFHSFQSFVIERYCAWKARQWMRRLQSRFAMVSSIRTARESVAEVLCWSI